ncbi:hypothetical protein I4U23_025964 [Adineta vaga]|nr:hypothetical protein I4U23_025964 [Adineta vaga]
MHSIFVIAIFLVFLQLAYVQSYQSGTKLPSILDMEASQWLTTRNIPRRWRQQYFTNEQQPDEVNQLFDQLQTINDNGIRQFDSQSFDGMPMEVLYELNQRNRKSNRY